MHSTNIGSIPAVLIYANTQALANLESSPVYSQDWCQSQLFQLYLFPFGDCAGKLR